MCSNRLFSRRAFLLLWLMLPAAPGCGESAEVLEQRERAEFDRQVETIWKKNWAWVDGLQYLEKNGTYVDSDEPGAPRYDRPAVLPLLKRLSTEHGLKWHAVVDRKKRNVAVAIVGSYPDEDGVRQAVMDALNEEQKSFPLDILVQTGNRWLSLDFLTPDDAAFLEARSAG